MFDTVEKYHNFFKILLGLIAASFVTFGVHAFTAAGHDYIAEVGDEKVSEQELRRVMQNNQIAADEGMREQVFRSLLQQAYLIEGGKKMGITVSDEQIKGMIVKEAAFSENGHFSQQKYAQFLHSGHLSEAQLVESLRKEFISQNVLHILSSSVMVSDAQAKQLLQVYDALRDVQVATFKANAFVDKVVPKEADLQKFYQENQQNYTIAQAIRYAYVKADVDSLQAQQEVSEQELKTRQAADPNVDSAILEAQIKNEKATRALSVVKETMADVAFNQAKDIQAVAEAAKLPVKEQKEWQTQEQIKQSTLPAVVQEALFNDDVLKNGNNSYALEAKDGSIWVVRVQEVRAAKTLPFDAVVEQVRQDLIQQTAHKMAHQAAQEAFATLNKGEAVNDVVWQEKQTLSLLQAKTILGDDGALRLMRAVPEENKPAYVLLDDTHEPIILKVLSIRPGEEQANKILLAKNQLTQLNTAQAVDAYLTYLERTVKYKSGLQKVVTEQQQ